MMPGRMGNLLAEEKEYMRKELNMARRVIVVNGPNLGRLGVREPDVYGHQDLETLRQKYLQ